MEIRDNQAKKLSTIEQAQIALDLDSLFSRDVQSWVKARWLQLELRQRGMDTENVLDILKNVTAMFAPRKSNDLTLPVPTRDQSPRQWEISSRGAGAADWFSYHNGAKVNEGSAPDAVPDGPDGVADSADPAAGGETPVTGGFAALEDEPNADDAATPGGEPSLAETTPTPILIEPIRLNGHAPAEDEFTQIARALVKAGQALLEVARLVQPRLEESRNRGGKAAAPEKRRQKSA